MHSDAPDAPRPGTHLGARHIHTHGCVVDCACAWRRRQQLLRWSVAFGDGQRAVGDDDCRQRCWPTSGDKRFEIGETLFLSRAYELLESRRKRRRISSKNTLLSNVHTGTTALSIVRATAAEGLRGKVHGRRNIFFGHARTTSCPNHGARADAPRPSAHFLCDAHASTVVAVAAAVAAAAAAAV